MARKLRSGYTTGACAAAAAKAAAVLFCKDNALKTVEIPFPDGSRHRFKVHSTSIDGSGDEKRATASIIKDAGDDPDVTNGAEISATVHFSAEEVREKEWITVENVQISAGVGVGTVTKPGLAVPVGEPAINPVPRQMICKAVQQVESEKTVHVSISIPRGEELAEKTLNHRLGIVGGLSILGTTGIVRPVSADAWKATIEASMNVAREAGLDDIVLSTGRTSEKGAQSLLDLAVRSLCHDGRLS
jgi:cobalt-precorrin-5B (C1)-methyltransferase